MENFEKYISDLPKAKLSVKADRKIKFRLYKLIALSKLEDIFSVFSLRSITFNRGVALAFGMLVVIFSATSFYAYASNAVIPGSSLYPIKIAIEKIEQKIAVSNTAKIANYEKISNRRLEEAVSLSKASATLDPVASNNANENIKNNINAELANHMAVVNSINSLGNTVNATATAEVINKAQNNDKQELYYLNRIAENAKQTNNTEIIQKVNEAQKIIIEQKYNDNANNYQEPTGNTNQPNINVEQPKANSDSKQSENSGRNSGNSQNSDNIRNSNATNATKASTILSSPEHSSKPAVINQPEIVTKQSEAKVNQPIIIKQPETVIKQPETVIKQPETVIKQPETVIKQPESNNNSENQTKQNNSPESNNNQTENSKKSD